MEDLVYKAVKQTSGTYKKIAPKLLTMKDNRVVGVHKGRRLQSGQVIGAVGMFPKMNFFFDENILNKGWHLQKVSLLKQVRVLLNCL